MDFQEAPVTVSDITDGFRVTMLGPIHTNVSWIEREFKRVIDAKPKRVELDLSKTQYISSLGVGVLVAFRNGIDAVGGVLHVVSIDNRAYQVLKYAHLTKVLNVDPAGVIEAKA